MSPNPTSLPPGPRGGPGLLGPWTPQRPRTRARGATEIAGSIFVRMFGKSS
jgi:hypothetical protein